MKLIILIPVFLFFSSVYSQELEINFVRRAPMVKVLKTGPYIGLQRGKFTNLELGYELQRKAVKLVKPTTHAFNTGFDYNLTENILGFSAGYWQKKGRMDLTFGGNLVYKTNFEQSRFGIAPMVGFKFSWAHLQVGYNLLTKANDFENYNTFFISIRAVMINNRDYKWRKRKKKKD